MRGQTVAAFALLIGLAGCGGGSSSGGSVPVQPPGTASASAVISAASGGSISTSINGETVTLTVPSGALSGSSTVTLTAYLQSALPRSFAAYRRKPESVPGGSTFIIGIGVDVGSATLTEPLALSVAGIPSVPTGDVFRLAGSQSGSYNDVDTASLVNGTLSEAHATNYPGVTVAGSGVTYAFYAVAPSAANPAPTITITVSGPGNLIGGASGSYAAAEAANGFPFLAPPIVFSLDSSELGTIGAASGTLSASTANNAVGHVIASDHRSSATGSLAVTVRNSRPANAGDASTYTGTLTTTIANEIIAAHPVSTTQAANVTQTVHVASYASGKAVVNSTESDAFPVSTLTTQTTSTIGYQTSGASTNVRLVSTSATDSNGAAYTTQYTSGSGLLTIEPETPGSFGPNDAARTTTESEPGINAGGVTTNRTTNTDGSYSDTTTNADGTINTAVMNADGSGTYDIDEASGFSFVMLAFGAPAYPQPPAARVAKIAISGTVQTTPSQSFQASIDAWFPVPIVPYTETDTIAATTAYDSRCSVPAKYGTTAAQITQTITSVDTVFGNLDNQTTIVYDVLGVGTVCSIFTDLTQTFYDYTLQEPSIFTVSGSATKPVLSTATTEVLSLTAATIAGQPASTDAYRRAGVALGPLALATAHERFLHAVRQAKTSQALARAAALQRARGVH